MPYHSHHQTHANSCGAANLLVALNELAGAPAITGANETTIYNAIRSCIQGYSMPADVAHYAFTHGRGATYMVDDRTRVNQVKATFNFGGWARMSFFDWWAWGRLWHHWWSPRKRALNAGDIAGNNRAVLVYLNAGGGLHYILSRYVGGGAPYRVMDPAVNPAVHPGYVNVDRTLAQITGNLQTAPGWAYAYRYVGIAIIVP